MDEGIAENRPKTMQYKRRMPKSWMLSTVAKFGPIACSKAAAALSRVATNLVISSDCLVGRFRGGSGGDIVMETAILRPRYPWNKGILVGQKRHASTENVCVDRRSSRNERRDPVM